VADALAAELEAAHDAFVAALGTVDGELVTVPGVMADWSVRDIVVHVAAWSEHGTKALRQAVSGRGAEFDYSTDETDAINAGILAEARTTSPADALAREERAYRAFHAAVAALDESSLRLRLGNGDTVEEVIRYDGPEHYAEHTTHIRAWFGEEEGEEGE
jgi:hypothetical protein